MSIDMNIENKNLALPDKLSFQIIDWCIPFKRDSYDVNLYGVTRDGKSVMCKVTGFKPYFYVRAPLYLRKKDIEKYLLTLEQQLQDGIFKYRKRYVSRDDGTEQIIEADGLNFNDRERYKFEVVEKTDFWGFSTKDRFFVKVSVDTMGMFYEMRSIFETIKEEDNEWILYETDSNIPIYRFIHNKNIKPCGWLSVKTKSEDVDELDTNTICHYAFKVPYNLIKPLPNVNKIAPILIASFDIECTSSHGDFPMAIKDYKRLAQDLCENAAYVLNYSKSVAYIIKKAFSRDVILDESGNHKINRVHSKSNLSPQHLNSILYISNGIEGHLQNLIKNTKDYECQMIETTINRMLTKNLPGLYGDPIIQLCTTFH